METRKTAFTLLAWFVSPLLFAQQEVEMADALRANGKIYVVVAIVLLILAGLIGYLVLLDRKISRLEKRLSDRH